MENQINKFPLIGDKFPEMQVQTTHGMKKLPEDYQGKWVVLFSHPADFTPVCTTEFVAFAKRKEKFDDLNAELLGLSMDQVFSHIKWDEWIKEKLGVEINFPIIADAAGNVAAQLGMVHPGKGATTVRAVFLIDPNSIIRIILYYPQEIGRNMEEILRALKALQVSDEQKVAIPANWPDNELIGNRVIVPPATDVKTAQQRLKEFECYDWWFCHKPLK
jgi:peroxiredoxin 2/4